jgi:hypothetical protein
MWYILTYLKQIVVNFTTKHLNMTSKNLRISLTNSWQKIFSQQKIIFLLILIIALSLRLTGVDWDQGHHLHPDERFLNMLINDMSLPESWGEYLDPARSPLNPRNNDRGFYVYGNAPITLNKIVTETLGREGLHEIALTGRVLSALADSTILFVIYKTVQLFEKKLKKKQKFINKNTKLWACLMYALLVIPIQQSHFFTTDTFLNLFTFTSLYFILKIFFHQGLFSDLFNLIFSAIFFGLAVGSKISAVLFLPLLMVIIVLSFLNNFYKEKIKKNQLQQLLASVGCLLFFVFVSYFTLRLASPYLFIDANFLNPILSPAFLQNLKELKSWEGYDVWFPPAIQWINRPFTFGITNLAVFGMGLVSFSASVVGVIIWTKISIKLFRRGSASNKILALLMISIIGWLFSFVGYYALQFTQSVRYYLLIYPLLAMFAGLGLSSIVAKLKLNLLWIAFLIICLSIWPLMFISIYIQPHSRIQASHWIYNNIPANSLILTEHWDDGLPLHMSGFHHRYQTQQLPVFYQDDQAKWQEINLLLDQADYYILSSNRAWGSITRVPEKYPRMSQFYLDLFEGKTNYQLVAKFSSYPSLEYLGLPISFDDSWSEEAFTVYDHPEVYVFERKNHNPALR